ncbi:MAG: alanine racemase [Dethiobacteria bacterium]|jgi:alanine racemase
METPSDLGRPTWAEIDLDNLAFNVRELKNFLSDSVKLMAVVKANGYGHGAYEVSSVALKEGASMLGVASLEEGLKLRQSGIVSPILILGCTESRQNMLLLKWKLTPTLVNWEHSVSLSRCAGAVGKKVAVHIKIDTGMGRLGLFDPRDTLAFIERVYALPNIFVEGIYTHFAAADECEQSYTLKQLQCFMDIVNACRKKGINIPLKHAANSAATIEFPRAHLDMVRVGISLYGYYPSKEVRRDLVKLLPVMSLKSKVVFLKRVKAGTYISYGRTYQAPHDTLIATVALGYGDGLCRSLSNRGFMLVRGVKVPIVGRICMDQTMLDVGRVPLVREGDEVIALGNGALNADYIAELLDTISYEILCSVGNRVPRIYLSGQQNKP